MTVKTGAVSLGLIGFAAGLHAAAAQDEPEITAHQAPATFSSRVNLVSVPVVVRDSKGRAAANLRQDDFRLFDKGKQQEIIKFTVQRNGVLASNAPTSVNTGPSPQPNAAIDNSPEAAKAALPDHYIAYIFDDIHMNFGDLARMRAATVQHFATTLTPNSRAAIFTTSGRVFLDFTDDRDKLREALEKIMPGPHAMPPSASNEELGKHDSCPPDVSFYRADRVVNWADSLELAAAEAAAVACYGTDPSPPALGLMASHQALDAGTADTKSNLSSLEALIRRISTMPGVRSIVLVSSGFFVTSDLRLQEAALMDQAIRANVTLNGIDARGRFTKDTPEANAQGDAMRELADGTGGTFFEHDNGFKEGLDQLATPAEFVYVLGFSPQNLRLDGSYHGLKVSLTNPKGFEVQARRGYWAPKHAADREEQAKEEIQDAVFSLDEVRDIPLDLSTDFFKTSDTSAELTVESRLNLKGVKFRETADRNTDTLTVVTGLFDQDGHYVKGVQRVIELKLREQTLERLLSSGMAVEETFDLAPGRYVVRVVVRDSEGESMAARNGTVDIK